MKESSISSIIRLIRVRHWVKNLIVFLPAFFGSSIFEEGTLLKLFLAWLGFSLIASVVYIINDISDVESDRLHERKRNRPIAAGEVSVLSALAIAAILVALSLPIMVLLGGYYPLLVAGYFVVNILYSYVLKHIALVDLAIIATGFLIRVFVGSVVVDVPVSNWLVIMIFLGSIFIGLAKRREDAKIHEETSVAMRKSISGYSIRFIDQAMSMMAAVIIVAYIMYSLSEDVCLRAESENVYMTSAFVVLGMLRYLFLAISQNKGGAPVELLLSDRFLMVISLLWLGAFYLLLYA